jgi:Ca-activated chloride channel family protein
MSGKKIEKVREGANWVIGLLNDQDHLGIVTFDSSPTVQLPATRMTDANKDSARDIVDDISAGGGTDIEGGIQDAGSTLQGLGDGGVRNILLLSDGHADGNYERLAKRMSDRGVSIMSAGIGSKYNEKVIRTLAEHSQGEWRHISKPDEIREFFDETVTEMSTVVGANPTLTMDVTRGTEIEQVYQGSPQVQEIDVEWTDNTATLPIPDLKQGKTQKVVLEFRAPPRDPGDQFLLANITLEASGETIRQQIAIDYTEDPQKLGVHNQDIEFAFQKTMVTKTMIEAEDESDHREVDEQITRLQEQYPDHEDEATKLERTNETIMEEGQAAKEMASKLERDGR